MIRAMRHTLASRFNSPTYQVTGLVWVATWLVNDHRQTGPAAATDFPPAKHERKNAHL